MTTEYLKSPSARPARYSPAVSAAGLLFISGQLPIDPTTGRLVARNIAEQTARCLANVEEILTQHGLTRSNVVKTTCLLADIDDLPLMNDVYASVFADDPAPARVAVAVRDLPQGALIEIEAVAALDA